MCVCVCVCVFMSFCVYVRREREKENSFITSEQYARAGTKDPEVTLSHMKGQRSQYPNTATVVQSRSVMACTILPKYTNFDRLSIGQESVNLQ